MQKIMKSFFILVILFTSQAVFAKDGDIEICGLIESINESQVTLNGFSYPLEGSTEYKDAQDNTISLDSFSVGELIELRIRDGKVDQLEKEDEPNCGGSSDDDSDDDSDEDSDDDSDDDSSGGDKKNRERFCGKITDITSNTMTIGNRTLPVSNDTEFESRSGESLTLGAFVVGDFVKVDVRNGQLHEVEFESLSGCRSSKIVKTNKKLNQDRDSNRRIRLRTKLRADEGVSTSAFGNSQYRSESKKGKSKDRLTVSVKVPVPSLNPSISDESQASSLQLSLFFQRDLSTIAVCQLVFNKIEEGIAEYKIDLRERSRGFVAKKGSCDIDLTQPGIQNAIPTFKKGDTLTVVNSDLSTLLSGQY